MNQNYCSNNQENMRMMRGYNRTSRNAYSSQINNQQGCCNTVREAELKSGNFCMKQETPNCCGNNQRSSSHEIPAGNRSQLLNFINEVSFAVYEAILYLDTHPNDTDALRFFNKYNQLRERALDTHAGLYGPLTISAADNQENQCWEWMNQPWPWEGGDC